MYNFLDGISKLIMKNRKLYESIQNLVNRKDSIKKNKRNFAQDYCSQQLKKKKLIPKACTSKIDQLMKNFKDIKTYIDVDDVIGCVNEVYLEEEKAKKKEMADLGDANEDLEVALTIGKECIGSHKKCNSETKQPKILEKAKEALKEYHKEIYNKQNENIGSVVREFEMKSNYLCETMKNKQKFGFITEMQKVNRKKKLQHIRDTEELPKEKWNKYTRATTYTRTEPNEAQNENGFGLGLVEGSKLSHNNESQENYKKKKKMFDLAQIYLQIILEEEYRKKWNKDKQKSNGEKTPQLNTTSNFNPSNINSNRCISLSKKKSNRMRRSINKQSSIFNETGMVRLATGRSRGDKSMRKQNMKTVETLRCMQPSTVTQQGLQARPPTRPPTRPTTRIVKHKEIAIRKLNNFLLQLQQDENLLKNEKKNHLTHLNRLEKHFDQENVFRGNKIWRDEEKYQEIKVVLQRQDGK